MATLAILSIFCVILFGQCRFQCKKKVTLFPRLCIKEVVLHDCNSGGIENTIEKH